MPKEPKGRFAATPLPEVFEARRTKPGFDKTAHRRDHGPDVLVYTSVTTLDLVAGTEFYSPYSGTLAWARATCATAPNSTGLLIDILVGGVTIFDGNYLTIPASQKWGYRKIPDTIAVVGADEPSNAPDPIKVQINTINTATGPMIVYIGLWRVP